MAVLLAASACRGPGTPAATVGNRVSFAGLAGVTWGSGTTAVVFAHGFRTTKEAWAPFAETIAGRGFRSLAFDFRGYGGSRGLKDASGNDRDVEAAIAEIERLGATKVFVVGESMGGTAALIVGARRELAGVVAVSAPVAFLGLDASTAVGALKEPVLFIAAAADPSGAASAAQALYGSAPQPKELDIVAGTKAHGTDLLVGATAARVSTDIAQFLIDHR